jgi:hypothetical protein
MDSSAVARSHLAFPVSMCGTRQIKAAMKIRRLVSAVLAAVLAAPIVACAQQNYPARSVRLVLPFAAGSAVDVLARLYAQRMTEGWG